jgi:hypothetical protein
MFRSRRKPPISAQLVVIGTYGPYAALLTDDPAGPVHTDGKLDASLSAWTSRGFARAEHGASPPLLAGWKVHVRGRCLIGVTYADGAWWWQARDGAETIEQGDQWLAAMHGYRAAVLLTGHISINDVLGGPQFDQSLGAAIAAGRVAWGVASLVK